MFSSVPILLPEISNTWAYISDELVCVLDQITTYLLSLNFLTILFFCIPSLDVTTLILFDNTFPSKSINFINISYELDPFQAVQHRTNLLVSMSSTDGSLGKVSSSSYRLNSSLVTLPSKS